jgi:hypothetical protein
LDFCSWTVNGGSSWQQVRGLPTVAVHDLVVRPQERELVIGTHGRSIYILDVSVPQEVDVTTLSLPAYLFDVNPVTAYLPRSIHGLGRGQNFLAPNPPPGATIYYSLKEKPAEPVRVSITDAMGKAVAELKGPADAGLQRLQWNLHASGGRQDAMVPAGDYVVRIRLGDVTLRKKLRVDMEE